MFSRYTRWRSRPEPNERVISFPYTFNCLHRARAGPRSSIWALSRAGSVYFDSDWRSSDSYALFGGYARYAVTDSLSVALNMDNLTDEKYLSSVKYDQSYYAQPLDYSLSINWNY